MRKKRDDIENFETVLESIENERSVVYFKGELQLPGIKIDEVNGENARIEDLDEFKKMILKDKFHVSIIEVSY